MLDEKGSAPVTMEIHYLPAIEYAEYADMKPAQLAQLVHDRIAEKIRQVLAERSKKYPHRLQAVFALRWGFFVAFVLEMC